MQVDSDPPVWARIRRLSLEKFSGQAVAVWLLGFGLVIYLSLKGGGYDPILNDQAGIAIWWIVLAAVMVGAIPVRRLGRLAIVALGLLVALALWTALSASWTESPDKTATELARVATYLGVFTLALFVRGPKGTRRMVAAVGSGIAVVSLLALLSRVHPAWFPNADQTARFLSGTRNRLSYPLGYWNGLAELTAIGFPLILFTATTARSLLARAAAAGAMPVMGLTVFFTFSRAGTGAAVAGLILFLAVSTDRVPKVLTLLSAGAGTAILIAAANQRDALEAGLMNQAARHQGNEILVMTVLICVTVALVQMGLTISLRPGRRPRWLSPTRREARWGLIGGMVVVLVASVAFGTPSRATHAWAQFKTAEGPGGTVSRLESFRGNGRYQYWSAAIRENSTDPLKGTGSGTFEYWWARDGDISGFVRDTHSLYLQTLGELGIVGLGILLGFLGVTFGGGAWSAARSARRTQAQLAAALAGCFAFAVAAAFDWVWQIPVIPIVFLLLASVLVSAGDRTRTRSLAWPKRALAVGLSLIAILVLAVPLSSATLLRQSQDDARTGDLTGALRAAQTAQNVQPDAAAPRLQQALVLELQGNLGQAAVEARAATSRERTNWRTWLVLSRIEAERGRIAPSVRAYRHAHDLYPRYPLFAH